jgi:hypothetical protein
MKHVFSRGQAGALSSILAAVILLGSLPLTVAIVVVSLSNQPEITVNICQPIQTFDQVSNTLLARPATLMPGPVLCDLGAFPLNALAPLIEFRVPPDTPPPKHLG